MKAFMDENFLLETQTAQRLYHEIAAKMPLADYHCHLNPREIYEDRRFENLTQVWLGGVDAQGVLAGDHYKWRLMRAAGVSEDYVTGNQPAYERFLKFVQTLELAVGNPMYHWCHLELQQFFGIREPLNMESAPRIWEQCNRMLRDDPDMTARGLIRKANVAMIGTTDDPADDLFWHEKLAEDGDFPVKVCPSFRPDKALNIHKEGFCQYLQKLSEAVGGKPLTTVEAVCDALVERIEYFHARGCRASDHGFESVVPFFPVDRQTADAALTKALAGQVLTQEEVWGYQTMLMLAVGRAYHRLGIVMQIHYSCLRNTNARMFRVLGPDAGYDAMAQNVSGGAVAALLSALDETGQCPKTILYSLNPADNAQLGTLIGCFQDGSIPGKIQHGSAWWFNDNKVGMQDQLTSLANQGLLGTFVGMLTDSRSFLSYARHGYFRRILCNLIGGWVENGEYPEDEAALRRIVEGICFRNAQRYFDI